MHALNISAGGTVLVPKGGAHSEKSSANRKRAFVLPGGYEFWRNNMLPAFCHRTKNLIKISTISE